MPRWSERSIRSRQHPYPELQSKAWNVSKLKWFPKKNDLILNHCFTDAILYMLLPPHIQARVTIAWLDALTTDLSLKTPDDEQLVLMAKTVMLG